MVSREYYGVTLGTVDEEERMDKSRSWARFKSVSSFCCKAAKSGCADVCGRTLPFTVDATIMPVCGSTLPNTSTWSPTPISKNDHWEILPKENSVLPVISILSAIPHTWTENQSPPISVMTASVSFAAPVVLTTKLFWEIPCSMSETWGTFIL